ncbi:MAG: hypothetical protein NTX49_03880 [Chlamydiae bacterium]|nr:hypothetical protein [Chlamydiota bacterium]
MDINAVLNSVCENVTYAATTVGQGVYSAAEWMGRTICVIGQGAAQFAQNIIEWATPFFSAMGSFVSQNQGSIAIALLGVTVGAVGSVIALAAISPNGSDSTPASPAAI